ncbi:hypothetical protein M407DRAFT_34603 [Tulasnella calospora MUT 4182]|uniref:Uncharacterized protein n=1 Tax=Tulasnella calospora MUT 4182 TaxID=1051891 RepID=A0A0C3Q119_9AGAM|nr:hypothetical protein M407DRAFT_34603 [Tulasnella calospora MUT 4182]
MEVKDDASTVRDVVFDEDEFPGVPWEDEDEAFVPISGGYYPPPAVNPPVGVDPAPSQSPPGSPGPLPPPLPPAPSHSPLPPSPTPPSQSPKAEPQTPVMRSPQPPDASPEPRDDEDDKDPPPPSPPATSSPSTVPFPYPPSPEKACKDAPSKPAGSREVCNLRWEWSEPPEGQLQSQPAPQPAPPAPARPIRNRQPPREYWTVERKAQAPRFDAPAGEEDSSSEDDRPVPSGGASVKRSNSTTYI